MKKFDVSVGVIAHNEEKNIGALLRGLLSQKTRCCRIREIIVVSSASTDRTDEIVKCIKDKRVRLVRQKKRMGKACAVNIFIRRSKCGILVLSSADILVEKNAVEELVKPFKDESVCMTGAHPVPIDSVDTMFGFLSSLSWHVHHMNNLKNREKPKLGEMVAFRRTFASIHPLTSVDEAEIQSILHKKGHRQVYCPNAIVRNKGPSNLNDYLSQRLRINTGHMELSKRTGYQMSNYEFWSRVRWTWAFAGWHPKRRMWCLLGTLMDYYTRIVAFVQLNVLGRNPYKWDMVKSTKFNEGEKIHGILLERPSN